ncbi:hypothetical protein KUTeg_019890 [Tegillarca granosa]|uniref:Uncharacterized protein n=1 Tax=Tegillarca granosa TaxID=220873 RepID=A0ABQ9EFT6_TEGGR|nr:hypothetical protein KUTeg_019890 [Tegillarca granosa]
MLFNDIILNIDFGPYQKRLVFFLAVNVVMHGLQTMSTVFTMADKRHRCKISPEFFEINNVSMYDYGTGFDTSYINIGKVNATKVIVGECKVTLVHKENNKTRDIDCTSWIYEDSPETIISKFDLVCSRTHMKSHAKMAYLGGFLLASCTCGIGGDLFVAGYSTMAYFNIALIIGLELVGPRKRIYVNSLLMFAFCVGEVALCGVAYLAKDWKTIQIVISVPALISVITMIITPESPRWLLSKGKEKEVLKILEKISKSNKRTLPQISLEVEKFQSGTSLSSLSLIFRSKTLLLRLVILTFGWYVHMNIIPCAVNSCSNFNILVDNDKQKNTKRIHSEKLTSDFIHIAMSDMCVITMSYYGISYDVGNIDGNVYLNFLLSVIAEALGYAACLVLSEKLGRKYVHAGGLIIAGIYIKFEKISVPVCRLKVTSFTLGWMTIILSMIGKMCVSATFGNVFLYTTELFPTGVRSCALGTTNIGARIGGMVSPYIVDIGGLIDTDFGTSLPFIIFGVLAGTTGVLSLWIPETVNTNLPDNISDAIKLQRGKMRQDRIDIAIDGTAERMIHN